MSQNQHPNLALFIDFDNVALGARDARQRFDIKLLLQRVLEKGKIIVKRAYADWHYYKEHMSPLHEAAIELIEIPMPRISGKNSADIRLVVDAMDLCYSKDHVDTFVIVSGDSDFSPLVSKLRENNKRVIGIGVKNSSSNLLINNCDEFIFYDDIYRQAVGQLSKSVGNVPADKREVFDFLVQTAQGLLQESRGILYSSLIKDTMTRKQPDFNERAYGYGNFGELLEDARNLGLLKVERDARAGGTWVVQGLGEGLGAAAAGAGEAADGNGKTRSGRRRRRSGGRGRDGEGAKGEAGAKGDEAVAGEQGKGAKGDDAKAAKSTPEPKEGRDAKAPEGAGAVDQKGPSGAGEGGARGSRKKRSRRKPSGSRASAPADASQAPSGAPAAEPKAADAPAAAGGGPRAEARAKDESKAEPKAEPRTSKTAKKAAGKKTTKAPVAKTAKKTTVAKTTKKATAAKTTKKAAPTKKATKKTGA